MQRSKGFERLRRIAITGLLGTGALGPATVRATTIVGRTYLPIVIDRHLDFGSFEEDGETTLNSVDQDEFYGWNVSAGAAFLNASYSRLEFVDNHFLNGESESENILVVQAGYLYYEIDYDDRLDSEFFNSAIYDGVLGLKVNGQSFDAPEDQIVDRTIYFIEGDHSLQSDVREDFGVDGLDVRVKYYFFSDQPTVRAEFRFENFTSSPISFTAMVVGDLYQNTPGATFSVEASSDDNLTIEDSDHWYTVIDSTLRPSATNFGAGHVTLVKDGAGAEVTATHGGDAFSGATPDSFEWHYDLTVPAGERRYIIAFANHAEFLNIEQEVPVNRFVVQYPNAEAFNFSLGELTIEDLENADLLRNMVYAVKALTVNFRLDRDGDGIQDRDATDFFATPEEDIVGTNTLQPRPLDPAEVIFTENGESGGGLHPLSLSWLFMAWLVSAITGLDRRRPTGALSGTGS